MKEQDKKSTSTEKSVCGFCKKKIITLPFRCKFCALEFCDAHRLPEDHSCLGLAIRKEQIKSRLQRGERISYEPRARKEIKVIRGSDDGGRRDVLISAADPGPGEEHYVLDRKALTDPLIKSPLAIIGMVVAAIAIAAIIFLLLG